MEVWKYIPGYENVYMASNLGRIKSLSRDRKTPTGGFRNYPERILKTTKSPNGYFIACLNNFGRKYWTVHRLIAITFLDNPENLPAINHKDSNKENNEVLNLEWCTFSQNSKHSYNKGRQKGLIKIQSMQITPVIDTSTGKIYPSIRDAFNDLKPKCVYLTFVNRINKKSIKVQYYETKTN